jgi:hypothetical protein
MARDIGREFEVRAVEPRQLRQLIHRQHAVDQKHFVIGGRQRLLHEVTQLFRHLGVDLQPDHRSATPPLQRGFEGADEVFGLFLDFDFGVADNAEGALALHGVAREQPRNKQRSRLLQRDQPRHAFLGCGHADEAVDLAGHADQRVHRLAVGGAHQLQRDGETKARDEGEGMRRVDGKRRQQRKDVVEEVILDPGPFRFGDVAAVDQHDADFGEHVVQFAPDCLLVLGEARHRLIDEVELLERCAAVGAAFGDALADLRLDTGDADHEEFIKVICRYRQESHALQRRMAGIGRFLQHPAIEMQPGKLPVDEPFRA